MQQTKSIAEDVRAFVIDAFMYNDPGDNFSDDLNLVEAKIVDSINVLQLVEFIEETYDVLLEPEELHELVSVHAIANLIQRKMVG